MSQTPKKSSLPAVENTPARSQHCDLSSFLFELTPEKENDRIDCAICLSPLSRIDSDVTETKCKHFFHSSCLLEMKCKSKSQCPICRNPLTPLSSVQQDSLNQSSGFRNSNFEQEFNSQHVPTQIRIVLAARRGREAVQAAIARRAREELTDMTLHTNEIISF